MKVSSMSAIVDVTQSRRVQCTLYGPAMPDTTLAPFKVCFRCIADCSVVA